MSKIYVNDSGTLLILFTGYTIPDTATTTQIWIKRPDGEILKKGATVAGDALSYELLPTDIDAAGKYEASAHIVSPDFPTGKMGETFRFIISDLFT
jgi:hypothetical protein